MKKMMPVTHLNHQHPMIGTIFLTPFLVMRWTSSKDLISDCGVHKKEASTLRRLVQWLSIRSADDAVVEGEADGVVEEVEEMDEVVEEAGGGATVVGGLITTVAHPHKLLQHNLRSGQRTSQ
jgi:hypothetical protein